MRTYKYVCSKCSQEGTLHTTDSAPEKGALCTACWRKKVTDIALELIADTWPRPARLEFLTEMITKEHGLVFEPPSNMLRLTPEILAKYLKHRGVKFRLETMVFVDEDPKVHLEG